ncbi:MAG: hypothetical protein RIQ60_1811 [Pseudomonadota bacterium]
MSFGHRLLQVAAALLLASWATAAQAGDCQRVVFSAHPDYPPYHWAEGNTLQGASVALTGRLLDEIGVPWEARFVGPWPRVLKAAEHGTIDLVVSLKRNPEREVYLDFTNAPAFPNPMAVFVAQARPLRFDRPADLIGKRGGRSAGDRFGDVFDDYARQHLQIEDADSLSINFSKLAAGRIDYVITGLYTGRAHLLQQGLGQRISALPKPVNEGEVHHGFSRLSPCAALLPALDAKLAAAQRNGLAARLLEDALKQWQRSHSQPPKP